MPALTDLNLIPVTGTVEVVARDNPNNRKGVVPLPVGGGSVPAGTILMYGGTAVPDGYLLCNGQAVSRTGDYADLFAAIGVQFGDGDGVDTFNVPDFRGRAPVGTGEGTGLTLRNTGDTFGEEEHTLVNDEMPSDVKLGLGYYRLANSVAMATGYHPDRSKIDPATSGGNSPHNNMQPSLAVSYIIKY